MPSRKLILGDNMTQGTKDMLAIGVILAIPLIAVIAHRIYEIFKRSRK
jgi:hypothetical protein